MGKTIITIIIRMTYRLTAAAAAAATTQHKLLLLVVMFIRSIKMIFVMVSRDTKTIITIIIRMTYRLIFFPDQKKNRNGEECINKNHHLRTTYQAMVVVVLLRQLDQPHCTRQHSRVTF